MGVDPVFSSLKTCTWVSAVVVLFVFGPRDGWHDLLGFIIGRDFANFWLAARFTLEGNAAASYDFAQYMQSMQTLLSPQGQFMNFSYLPNALPVLAPLGLMPYGLALSLWTLAGLAAYVFAALGRQPFHGPLGRRAPLMLLLAPVSLLALGMGQASLLLAGLFVGGFRWLETRPRLAGVMFGLLALKPQIAIVLPIVLIAGRHWLALAYAALVAVGCSVGSILLLGIEPWRAYAGDTLQFQSAFLDKFSGTSGGLLMTPYALLRDLGLGRSLALQLHVGLAALIAIGLFVRARSRHGMAQIALLAALAAMLISPYGMAYDLVIPTAALAWRLSQSPDLSNELQRPVIGLFLALPVVAFVLTFFGLRLLPLLLCAFLIDEWRRDSRRFVHPPASPA